MRASRLLVPMLAALLLSPSVAVQAQSSKALDLTEEILDRFFTAHEKEKNESTGVSSELADTDAKISKFEQCRRDFEAAGSASGSRLGGIAARIAIKARCGASDADGYRKDRERIMAGPENAAATAGGFKLPEYRNLRDRLRGYLNGDRSGFTKAALDLLKSRESRLAGTFGISMGGGGGRGMRGPAVWNTDFTWLWISQFYAVQYLSGATMFEKDYAPGDWTRWTVKTSDDDETMTVERAFLGKQADGGEWWRTKSVMTDGSEADTISLEALFRPEAGNEYLQKLVRMRAKLPGSAEPQEMMVPEQWAMWNFMGSFSGKPTPESIEGATIGVEEVKTAAGTFRAKHIRFGQAGGTLDWWLDESSVGGWVKFQATGEGNEARYVMELVGKGTGAKSELGVVIK